MSTRSHSLACHLAAALAWVFCASVADSSAGEIYRWTDEQGNLHFTSDLHLVPKRYRNQSQPTVPEANIIVAEDGEAPQRKERLDALKRRGRELDRQREIAELRQKQSARSARDPGSEPRKYEYDCFKRTRNGRCRRQRTAAWDEWNELRKKYEAAE